MSDVAPPEPPRQPDERGRSAGAKWAIALVAVAAVVVAFVALSGGDDEPSGQTTTSAPASTATATAPGTAATATTETATTTAATSTAEPEPEPDTVRVVGGQPEGGVKTFTYGNGDEVRLRIVSDTADEVHVHGYDVAKDVEAGGEVEFEFEADIEGRFEVELEGSHTQIATLEVQP